MRGKRPDTESLPIRNHDRLCLDFLMKAENALIHKWTLNENDIWAVINTSVMHEVHLYIPMYTYYSKDKAMESYPHGPHIQSLKKQS